MTFWHDILYAVTSTLRPQPDTSVFRPIAPSLIATLLLTGCVSSGGNTLPAGTPSTSTTSVVVGTTLHTSSSSDFALTRDDAGINTTLDLPPYRVWDALGAAYQALGILPTTRDSERRLLGNDNVEPRSGKIGGHRTSLLLNCGTSPTGVPLADSYRVTIQLSSAVSPRGTGSLLTSRVLGSAASREIAGTRINCGSTGKLEESIARLVFEQTRHGR